MEESLSVQDALNRAMKKLRDAQHPAKTDLYTHWFECLECERVYYFDYRAHGHLNFAIAACDGCKKFHKLEQIEGVRMFYEPEDATLSDYDFQVLRRMIGSRFNLYVESTSRIHPSRAYLTYHHIIEGIREELDIIEKEKFDHFVRGKDAR